MPDELFAFAGKADDAVVVNYPELTKVSGIPVHSQSVESVGFTHGGAYLVVVAADYNTTIKPTIYNTSTWEAQETDDASYGTMAFSAPGLFPLAEEQFLLNGYVTYRDQNDGVWKQEGANDYFDFVTYPITDVDGNVTKTVIAQNNNMTAVTTYEVYEYDPSSRSVTQITLPSRVAETAWYSAVVSPSGNYMTLMRRSGPSGSYEWDLVVMDTSDWSVAAVHNAWITEAGSGYSLIEGAPHMTPDESLIVLVYYEGTAGHGQVWDFPGLNVQADNMDDGYYLTNELTADMTMSPDSAYAVVTAVDFSNRGHGKIDLSALDEAAPFPFANSGEFGSKPLIANDSAHIFLADVASGDVEIYDSALSFVGGFAASVDPSDLAVQANAMLTHTPTSVKPPPKFWTDLVGTREIRRA